jgi:hypothetical protein
MRFRRSSSLQEAVKTPEQAGLVSNTHRAQDSAFILNVHSAQRTAFILQHTLQASGCKSLLLLPAPPTAAAAEVSPKQPITWPSMFYMLFSI